MDLTAADLTVTEEAFKTIMDRETFVETQQFVDGATFNFTDAPDAVTEAAGETTEAAAAAVGGKEENGVVTGDNTSVTTPAPFENGDVDDVLIKDSETLAGLLRPVDISAQFPDGIITTTTELAETMTTIMAQEEFDGVEDLNDVTLTCDCFRETFVFSLSRFSFSYFSFSLVFTLFFVSLPLDFLNPYFLHSWLVCLKTFLDGREVPLSTLHQSTCFLCRQKIPTNGGGGCFKARPQLLDK